MKLAVDLSMFASVFWVRRARESRRMRWHSRWSMRSGHVTCLHTIWGSSSKRLYPKGRRRALCDTDLSMMFARVSPAILEEFIV